MADLRRAIPSADRLLQSDAFATTLAEHPRELVTSMLRRALDEARAAAADGEAPPDSAEMAARVSAAAARLASGSMVPVINATGVVLHTNLGRAPLAQAALDEIARVSAGYCNLEYDISTGARGSRYVHCRELLSYLTGAEDALVVNNNAAAVVLALNTLAAGREAVISRGELVEIGGAFRVPEIMARSGAVLREVGSTNRTHARDYEAAISPQTGALLKVHPSNFTLAGYTAEVTVAELGRIARNSNVPLIHDVGSGLLLDPSSLGLPPDEPLPAASLAAADVVTMSGDKLLGGPQCGIVLGRAEVIDRMRSNPLCRAFRVDRLTLAALAATLRLYLDPAIARREIPVLRMLTTPLQELETRAAHFIEECLARGIAASRMEGTSAVGGGASPAALLPAMLVRVAMPDSGVAALERRLRVGRPAVVARVQDDALLIDLRTVGAGEETALLQSLAAAFSAGSAD